MMKMRDDNDDDDDKYDERWCWRWWWYMVIDDDYDDGWWWWLIDDVRLWWWQMMMDDEETVFLGCQHLGVPEAQKRVNSNSRISLLTRKYIWGEDIWGQINECRWPDRKSHTSCHTGENKQSMHSSDRTDVKVWRQRCQNTTGREWKSKVDIKLTSFSEACNACLWKTACISAPSVWKSGLVDSWQDGCIHGSHPISQLIVRDSLIIRQVIAEQPSANVFLPRKWDFGTTMTRWLTARLVQGQREDGTKKERM